MDGSLRIIVACFSDVAFSQFLLSNLNEKLWDFQNYDLAAFNVVFPSDCFHLI